MITFLPISPIWNFAEYPTAAEAGEALLNLMDEKQQKVLAAGQTPIAWTCTAHTFGVLRLLIGMPSWEQYLAQRLPVFVEDLPVIVGADGGTPGIVFMELRLMIYRSDALT